MIIVRWLLFSLLLSQGLVDSYDVKIGLLHRLSSTDGKWLGTYWSKIAACSVLAIRHVNRRFDELVPDAAMLPVKFNVSYTMRDSSTAPSKAVEQTHQMVEEGVKAIAGPFLSATSGPVSLLSGIWEIPVLAIAATASSLSDKTNYPYFGRVVLSDDQKAARIAEMCQSFGWNNIALLYQDDAWGSGSAEGITSAAGKLGVRIVTSQKFSHSDKQSIQSAVAAAAAYGGRIFFFSVLREAMDDLLFAAEDSGITGRGYAWISNGGAPSSLADSSDPARFQRLLSGVIQPTWGLPEESELKLDAVLAREDPSELYDPLLGGWDDVKDHLTSSAFGSMCGFAYDATWAQALALSRAARSADGEIEQSDVLRQLRQLDFIGATGRVRMDPATGDRQDDGFTLAVHNWLPAEGEGGEPTVRRQVVALFSGNASVQRVAEPVWPGGAAGWHMPLDGFSCSPGERYDDQAFVCDKCPPGTALSGTECTPCSPGFYAPDPGMTQCLPCGLEGFANESGLSRCHRCPRNFAIDPARGPSSDQAHCQCKAGYVLNCQFQLSWVVLVGVGAAAVAVGGVMACVIKSHFQQTVYAEDKLVHARIRELRRRLKLRRCDGARLDGELSGWRVLCGRVEGYHVRTKILDNVARMTLLLDFDVKQVDVFAGLLHYMAGAETPQTQHDALSQTSESILASSSSLSGESSRYSVLRHMLLDMTKRLLDPRLPQTARDARSDTLTWVRLPSSEERFEFFTSKIAQLRIWEEGNNFQYLKGVAQFFMDDLRVSCDELFERILREEQGQELLSLRLDDNATHISRQDHPAVKAIPVVDALQDELHARKALHDGPRSPGSLPRGPSDGRREVIERHVELADLQMLTVPASPKRRSAPKGHRDSGEVVVSVSPHRTSSSLGRFFGSQSSADGCGIDAETMLRDTSLRVRAARGDEGEGAAEEPFIHWLLNRAEVLNDGFQQHVRELCEVWSLRNSAEPAPDDRPHVITGPIKTKQRMKEKVAVYREEMQALPSDEQLRVPLTAMVLDPVRASIVCNSPKQVRQLTEWIMRHGGEHNLPVVRLKNKFAVQDSTEYDGYRDIKLCVVFTGSTGLKIIGEIQLQETRMHALKRQMHRLYKVKRATSAAAI